MKQTVRIIGGIYRGKKLNFPDIEGLRPTPDRVRETLFNWLMHDIRQARCLDAFAGSGALGFEAWSRGAKQVVLIEKTLEAYTSLKRAANTFDAAGLQVIYMDAYQYIKQSNQQFDLIFIDPPYAQQDERNRCLEQLYQSDVLPPSGLVFVESNVEMQLDPACWQEIKLKRAGQVVYALYKKIGSAIEPSE